ncbi:MAG TPA: MarC family protein [Terriglobales bacterium]|nr:MarC family protein [Terriglobales bacterium]
MLTILKYFGLAFSALLPLINPLGSALMFMGIVGLAPVSEFRQLAKKVAISTVLFLLVIEAVGATLLSFFGISLPVVQLAGGFVIAAIGWGLLNQSSGAAASGHTVEPGNSQGALEDKVFYPLTFPITAGPGSVVVMLTLSAHASSSVLLKNALGHVGIAIAVVALSYAVYLCYTYAPKITQKISPSTVQGILRVIAFVLLCIGVQIAWNGLEGLLKAMPK